MSLSPFFKLYLGSLILNISIIFALIITIAILLSKKKKDKDLYKYKIYNFYLNYIFIVFYVLFYLFLILFIRFGNFFCVYDLKPIKQYFIDSYQKLIILDFIFVCVRLVLLFFIFLLILSKIHAFFMTEILKRYIIITKKYFDQSTHWKMQDRLIFQFETFLYLRTPFILTKNNKMRKTILFLIRFMVRKLPLYLLFLLFFYDLFYGNFILNYFLKYLPFYLIYKVYFRFSNFHQYNDFFLNEMLYNMYYCEFSIIYANMDEQLENIVYSYVDNGLQDDILCNLDVGVYSAFPSVILQHHMFVTIDNGKTYHNLSDEFFEEPNNNRKDIIVF